jgi:hypothetical protein
MNHATAARYVPYHGHTMACTMPWPHHGVYHTMACHTGYITRMARHTPIPHAEHLFYVCTTASVYVLPRVCMVLAYVACHTGCIIHRE